jgi:SAM-dependent methyltransferase
MSLSVCAPVSPREAHVAFLRERVFQTATKWPHYARLLDDLLDLAAELPRQADVVILERSYVYGGDSLFAPLFQGQHVHVVDCQLATTAARDGFQKTWTDDPRCLHVRAHRRAAVSDTGLADASADALLVPNVIHHVRDQDAMFAEFARLLRPGGTGYLFEALLRELHQIPDDYVRYTPWGLEAALARHGLEMTAWKPAGGPFEAIAYCWVQALQHLPPAERAVHERWFTTEHLPLLLAMDDRYPQNLSRAHTAFPVAYSVYFRHRSDSSL